MSIFFIPIIASNVFFAIASPFDLKPTEQIDGLYRAWNSRWLGRKPALYRR